MNVLPQPLTGPSIWRRPHSASGRFLFKPLAMPLFFCMPMARVGMTLFPLADVGR